MHSTRVPAPCGQSGTWKAIYLLVQFSKSCCVESFPLICGSGVISGVHKQPYLVIFLRPSLSRTSLVLSSSWGSPVGSEGWEGFVHPVLKGVSLDSTQVWGQAAGKRKNQQRFTLPSRPTGRFTGKERVKVTQSCPTLCDPMDYTVHGIPQARILEWGAFPFSRGSSKPRDRTQVSRNAGRFFTSWETTG